MKAASKVEKFSLELDGAKAKLAAYEKERDELADKRIPLENERAALVLPSRDGDKAAATRLKTVKGEIVSLAESEAELADVIEQQRERIAALEIAVRAAIKQADKNERDEIDKTLGAQAAKVDALLAELVAALQEHNATFGERNRISARLGDGRPVGLKHALRTILATVSDLEKFGLVREGRAYRSSYAGLLARALKERFDASATDAPVVDQGAALANVKEFLAEKQKRAAVNE